MLKPVTNRGKPSNSSRSPVGPAIWVFILGFSLPGIGMTVASAVMNWKATQYRNWVEVEAKPLIEGDTKNLKLQNVRYTYRFEGRYFESTGTGKNLDSAEEERLLKKIKKAIRNNETLSCWLDPKNPSTSILVRDGGSYLPLFFAIFGLSHGVTGMAIGANYFRTRKSGQDFKQRSLANPGNPELWRNDWASGFAKSSNFNTRWLWLYALAVCTISIWWTTANLFLLDIPGRWYALGACFLGLIPLHFFRLSMRSYRINQGLEVKFGEGLRMGQQQRITVRSESTLPGGLDRDFTWELANLQENTDSEKTTIEHSKTKLTAEGQSLSVLTLRGEIPMGKATTGPSQTGRSYWALTGKGCGIKIGPFELPISSGGEIDSEFHGREEEEVVSQPILTDFESFQSSLEQENIRIRNEGQDVIFEFPPNRIKGVTLVCFLIGFAFITIGLILMRIDPADFFLKIVAAGLLLMGGLCLFGGIRIRFGRTEIRSGSDQITLSRRCPGSKLTRTIRLDEVESIEAKENLTINNHKYYHIKVKLKTGEEKSISPLFSEIENCRLLAEFLSGDDVV